MNLFAYGGAMRKIFIMLSVITVCMAAVFGTSACSAEKPNGAVYSGAFEATLYLEATADNPVITRVIADFGEEVEPVSLQPDTFTITAGSRRETGINTAAVSGLYPSDAEGNAVSGASRYITFDVEPDSMPSLFLPGARTQWAASYDIEIDLAEDKTVIIGGSEYSELHVEYDAFNNWTCLKNEMIKRDDFTFENSEGPITLQRALYTPEEDGVKNALIVWLHGSAGGGTNVNVPLLKSNVISLAYDNLQGYFTGSSCRGAYVAVIQCPTMWMDESGGSVSNAYYNAGNGQPSYYTEALAASLDDLIENNPDIDADRVYIAGCSNGGYMAVELAVYYGDKYAAYVPVCEAYMNGNISDEVVDRLASLNIWFVHSDDDLTVDPMECSVPLYYRLIGAGAENVRFTYVTGYGHGVWRAFFDDDIRCTFDEDEVKEDLPVLEYDEEGTLIGNEEYYVNSANCTVDTGSIFAWLALQSRQ